MSLSIFIFFIIKRTIITNIATTKTTQNGSVKITSKALLIGESLEISSEKADADAEAARRAATPQQQNNYPYQPQNNGGYPQFGFPGMQMQ